MIRSLALASSRCLLVLVAGCTSGSSDSGPDAATRPSSRVTGSASPSSPTPPTSPGVSVLDPTSLPMGAVAAVPVLNLRSGVLMLPGGSRRHLRPPGELWSLEEAVGQVFVMYGRENGVSRVTAVSMTTGRRLLLGTRVDEMVVSADGSQVAIHGPTDRYIGERPSDMLVKDVATGTILHRTFNNANLAALGEGHAILTSSMFTRSMLGQGTFDWDLDAGTVTRLTKDDLVSDVDWQHERGIFARPTGRGQGCARMARLWAPRETLWSVPCHLYRFEFSPDGRYVLALGRRRRIDEVTMLNARSGRIVSTIPVLGGPFGWESRTAFLVGAESLAKVTAVVRCRVKGGCERVSEPFAPEPNRRGALIPAPMPYVFVTR